MATVPKSNPTVQPTGRALGADVIDIDVAAVDDAMFRTIHAAWMDHLVLRFRGQNLSDDALQAFARRFGSLDLAPLDADGRYYLPEHPHLCVISNVKDGNKALGALGNAESAWHTDMSYEEVPPCASLLYALEVPPRGGDTGFANMYAAAEALPKALRERIATLAIKHDATTNSTGKVRLGFEPVPNPKDAPGAVHPVLRTHPVTQRQALFLGRRVNAYVLGLEIDRSEALLDELWEHATRPDFTWTQQWEPGDLIIWDNRCVMHRRDEFDPSARRTLHRAQVKGERPS